MGNCMETCKVQQEGEHKGIELGKDGDNFVMKDSFEKNNSTTTTTPSDIPPKSGSREVKISSEKSGVRVKMVLTKEELKWLMMHLSNREGDGNNNKRIEDVLGEIEKGRKKSLAQTQNQSQGWKPSLDSITEIPEVLEMHR